MGPIMITPYSLLVAISRFLITHPLTYVPFKWPHQFGSFLHLDFIRSWSLPILLSTHTRTGHKCGLPHALLTPLSTWNHRLVSLLRHRPGVWNSIIIGKPFIHGGRLNFWRAYSGTDGKTRWVRNLTHVGFIHTYVADPDARNCPTWRSFCDYYIPI